MSNLTWGPDTVVASVAGELYTLPEMVVEALREDREALSLFRLVVNGDRDLADLVEVVASLI